MEFTVASVSSCGTLTRRNETARSGRGGVMGGNGVRVGEVSGLSAQEWSGVEGRPRGLCAWPAG